MRFLLDHGNHRLSNLGDLAALQVAARRFRQRFPGAQLTVPTFDPDRLRKVLPEVQPLDLSPRFDLAKVVHRALQLLPVEMRLRIEHRLAGRGPNRSKPFPDDLVELASRADAALHAGAGVLADPFAADAIRRLRLLQIAQAAGVPTAALSQGLGPVTNPDLERTAAEVLPALNLLAVRDRRTSPEIARRLGVSERRLRFSGDDSLSLAAPPHSLGQALGFNLRLADYAGIGAQESSLLEQIASVLRLAQRELSSELLPLIIDRRDQLAAGLLIRSHELQTVGLHKFNLAGLTEALSRCRVVVSGSYHGAVLALAQGAPAIGLFRSQYYRLKFEGLEDAFGPACRPLDLSRPDFEGALTQAVDSAWREAEALREACLERTADLVERSEAAYQEFFDLLGD